MLDKHDVDKLDSYSKSVDVYPLVKHYMDELNLFELFKKYVPKGDAELEPAEGLCILIVNILTANHPLSKVEEWLADYADGKGETIKIAAKYNDDRLGRSCLDGLYLADRNSLLTEISVMAIKVHELMTDTLHNDTTSLTLRGAYENSATTDGIKPARGYNKDGHPDCKQIVFGLNVTGDGHVPISYMAHDGNTNDSGTHIPNWDKLRELLNKEDFIYVADSKAADIENLNHIAGNGGKFISVLPSTRSEVKEFRKRLKNGEKIAWKEGYCQENSRKKGEFTTYHTFETKSKEDYRILWIHSDSKARADAMKRQKKINTASQELQNIANNLNRYQLKTREKIEGAVQKATKGVEDYVVFQITEHTSVERKQIGRGRAGPNTKYVDVPQTTFELNWQLNAPALKEAACIDGIFPLISNSELTAMEVLQTYKQQSYLEKRHSTLKTVEKACPIYLKKPERIEAMLFLYFVALMIISLIERNIRNKMTEVVSSNSSESVVSASSSENQTVSLKDPIIVMKEACDIKPINEFNNLPECESKPAYDSTPVHNLPKNQLPESEMQKPALSEHTVQSQENNQKTIPKHEPKPALSPNTIQPLVKNQKVTPSSIALPILPQDMKTQKPTWNNLKYFFRSVYQEVITFGEDVLKTIVKGMTLLHFQVLELLSIPPSVYDNLDGPWWKFQN